MQLFSLKKLHTVNIELHYFVTQHPKSNSGSLMRELQRGPLREASHTRCFSYWNLRNVILAKNRDIIMSGLDIL